MILSIQAKQCIMKYAIYLLPATLSLSVSTATDAWAQSEAVASPTIPSFVEADGNKDSGVDRDEFGRIIIDRFGSRDLNRDGVITLDEFGQSLEATFSEADRNKDGKLSQEELLELRLREFDRLDRNRNNVLGPIEYRQWGLDD